MVPTPDGGIERLESDLEWPAGFDRTDPDEREPSPGDLEPTREESYSLLASRSREKWAGAELY